MRAFSKEPRRRNQRPWWPRRRLLTIGLLAGVVGIGLVLLFAAPVSAALDLKAAQDDLSSAQALLKARGLQLSTGDVASLSGDCRRAASHFHQARETLQHAPVFRLISVFPFARRQIDATADLSDAGEHAAQAALYGTDSLRDLAAAGVIGPGAHWDSGMPLWSIVTALNPRLDAIAGELSVTARDVAAIPQGSLLGPIDSARRRMQRLNGATAAIGELRRNEPGLSHILSATGAQSYLVLQQDSAEMRATGGFVGTVAFLNFDRGRMAPYQSQDIAFLDFIDPTRTGHSPVLGQEGGPLYVAPPQPFRLLIGPESWELRDANWSPDFPTTARQAQFFLERQRHLTASGVIAIDPFLIQRILAVVGPVNVSGLTVDDKNFYQQMLFDVHHGGGKGVLAAAAKVIMGRLTALNPSQLLALLDVVGQSCQSRSLQVHFDDPISQELVDRYQCGGELRPIPGDGVMVVDSNMGASKDDFWVQRNFNLAIDVNFDGSARHALHLKYDGSQLVPRDRLTLPYRDWVRVYLPHSARVIQVEGIRAETSQDLGRTVVQGWLEFTYGRSGELTIVYDVPPTPGSTRHLALYWQKQAGRLNDSISVSIRLPLGWSMQATRQSSDSIKSDLSVDRQFLFSYQPD